MEIAFSLRPNLKLFLSPTYWMPASAGMMNYDTVSCARGIRPFWGSHLYPICYDKKNNEGGM